MVKESRSPYNMPPANRDVDDLTYNPQADAHLDNEAYDESTGPEAQPAGVRGAENQPTFRDLQKEDQETERSEQTGQIPRAEVDDLLSSTVRDERNVSGHTRGKRVDAYRQERDLDSALDETGVSSAVQDVEIGAATGRR